MKHLAWPFYIVSVLAITGGLLGLRLCVFLGFGREVGSFMQGFTASLTRKTK